MPLPDFSVYETSDDDNNPFYETGDPKLNYCSSKNSVGVKINGSSG